jgi:hypothetical protein
MDGQKAEPWEGPSLKAARDIVYLSPSVVNALYSSSRRVTLFIPFVGLNSGGETAAGLSSRGPDEGGRCCRSFPSAGVHDLAFCSSVRENPQISIFLVPRDVEIRCCHFENDCGIGRRSFGTVALGTTLEVLTEDNTR